MSTALRAPTHVVGIGASAGGLEPIAAFFTEFSLKSGAAFVVVQHLSPDFKSLMDEILARYTDLRILRVEDGMEVEANSIYLIPPKQNMIISNGRLLLSEQTAADRATANMPIDLFFKSLANECRERAIAVVLSGTGSDGSRGITTVHDEGGLVLVQDPEDAKFDGMPRSAIATGIVDSTLTEGQLPSAVLKHIGVLDDSPEPLLPDVVPELTGVDAVFAALQEHYGIPFDLYRTGTVGRRLERRVNVTGASDIDEYARSLVDNPDEIEILYHDMLIGVTQFFRDGAPWYYLEQNVIPDLFEAAVKDQRELRVWVAGCSSGEEAYSIAILLDEYVRRRQTAIPIKVIATDVHERSVDVAAAGCFDESISQHISSDRLSRCFTQRDGKYHIKPEIRRTVIFAPQNVLTDAPFTNIDLVICRNLLIWVRDGVCRGCG
jgi:two-component system CheB/CheR fusion protein